MLRTAMTLLRGDFFKANDEPEVSIIEEVQEGPVFLEFSSSMRNIDWRIKPTIRISHQDRESFIESSVQCLTDVYTYSPTEYKKLVDDLMSKFNQREKIEFPIQNKSKFNWYSEGPISFVYEGWPISEKLNLQCSSKKKYLISNQVGMLNCLMSSILENIDPEMRPERDPEILFNIFFDMIYSCIHKRAIEFYYENKVNAKKTSVSCNKACQSADLIQAHDYFANTATKHAFRDRRKDKHEFLQLINNIRTYISVLHDNINAPPDEMLIRSDRFLEGIEHIYGHCDPLSRKFDQYVGFDKIITFLIDFLSSDNPGFFESVIQRSLSSCNDIKFLLILIKDLPGFSKINRFDLTRDNFRFYFIAQMIDCASGFSDAKVNSSSLKLDPLFVPDIEFFRRTFKAFSTQRIKDFLFCSKTIKICEEFLKDPNYLKKENIEIKDIFNDEEIYELKLFGIIELLNEEVPAIEKDNSIQFSENFDTTMNSIF